MAAATSCARVLVPVLAIALRTCVLTVSVVTNRSSAISRLVAPSADAHDDLELARRQRCGRRV